MFVGIDLKNSGICFLVGRLSRFSPLSPKKAENRIFFHQQTGQRVTGLTLIGADAILRKRLE